MLRSRLLLLALLLLLPSAGAALLEDGTGDVTARHFEQTYTPVPGWEAMDLVSLDIEELPDVLRFTVRAAGLEGVADYDAGNYFVYVARGEAHYTVRMYQDNQGTAVVSELLVTEGRDVFGAVIARLEANIDTATGTITTDVPRGHLIDQDGAAPARGQTLSDIVVSAEAHATGVYTGGFSGLEGGPVIIGDRMPDDWSGGATAGTGPSTGPANLTFRYGGGERSGPVDLTVERPYRASNGEATIYVHRVTATNLADTPQTLILSTGTLPDGWDVRFPGPRLTLQAGQNTTFDTYLRVPFQHVHGATLRTDLVLTSGSDPDTWARAEVGVHYLTTAQPSGHHPLAYLHSAARPGLGGAQSLLGDGDAALFWNTLEDDPQDQGLPMSGIAEGTTYHWSGCLSPRLALGLTPDTAPGLAELTLDSQIPLTGTVSGTLSLIQTEHDAYCFGAHQWSTPRTPVARIGPVTLTVDGRTDLTSAITALLEAPQAHAPGTDLLLELAFEADQPLAPTDGLDLLPGGRLQMPLVDHHDAAPDILPGENGTTTPAPEAFVPETGPDVESPATSALGALAVVVAGVLAVRRRHR